MEKKLKFSAPVSNSVAGAAMDLRIIGLVFVVIVFLQPVRLIKFDLTKTFCLDVVRCLAYNTFD